IQALDGSRVQIEDSGITIGGGHVRTLGSGELLIQDSIVIMNQVAFGNQGTTTVNDASLIFNGATIDNGFGGSIAALSTAVVEFQDTAVHGGTLSADPMARLASSGASQLVGVSVSGAFENSGSLTIGGAGAAISGSY